jgi:hypothetical protein
MLLAYEIKFAKTAAKVFPEKYNRGVDADLTLSWNLARPSIRFSAHNAHCSSPKPVTIFIS